MPQHFFHSYWAQKSAILAYESNRLASLLRPCPASSDRRWATATWRERKASTIGRQRAVTNEVACQSVVILTIDDTSNYHMTVFTRTRVRFPTGVTPCRDRGVTPRRPGTGGLSREGGTGHGCAVNVKWRQAPVELH